MRILQVNKRYGFEGGIEQYLHAASGALERRGHEVRFLAGERDAEAGYLPDERVQVVPEIMQEPFRRDPHAMLLLREAALRARPDVIYLHHLQGPSLIEALEDVAPIVRFAHMEDVVCPMIEKSFSRSWEPCTYRSGAFTCGVLCPYVHRHGSRQPMEVVERLRRQREMSVANRRVRHWVVASEFMRRSLVREGIAEASVSVIPYFTELPSQASQPPIENGRIVFAGRLVESKGAHYLLQALAMLAGPYSLDMVGEGPELRRLKSLAEELGISGRVRFHGWLANERIRPVRDQAGAIVVPSLFQEPFGIVGIEAMAQARPVIAHDVGGVSQWLKDGETGFLVPSKSVEAMAERISEVFETPGLAARMGEAARGKVATEFVESIHMEKLERAFKNVLS